MNSAVKIIKRGQKKVSTEFQDGQDGQARAQSTREIAKTIKGWISELHQRRRDEQVASSALMRVELSVPTLLS
ncbi:MAG TPA: hypothetical protein VN643_10170 [Pyrinomonadaceae bacterium]|nr:hypothetical protein [Pyrinomonadaceae bacterium]